jgi:hypothetical protein
MRLVSAAVLLAASCLIAAPAYAETVKYMADLSAQKEVPPHPDLKGTGMVEATVDPATLKMTYHLTYDGLTGAATMAHFHGPAVAGKNAGVMVPVAGTVSSGMDGSATLTAAQFKAMEDGSMYFNIHTAANPGGEIRGQLAKE